MNQCGIPAGNPSPAEAPPGLLSMRNPADLVLHTDRLIQRLLWSVVISILQAGKVSLRKVSLPPS